MVSKFLIKNAIMSGVIRFVIDPNMDSGTVCKIGDSWFYFGGITAEEENPEEYVNDVPIDDIVNEIYEVLEDFSTIEDFIDEYKYYESILLYRNDDLDGDGVYKNLLNK